MGMVGGQYFAIQYAGFKPVANCDLSNVDESVYSNTGALIASIIDLDTCKHAYKTIFLKSDLDKNNYVSRCENAKALYGGGNTKEYALNYSAAQTLPGLYQI